ncbi:hypothetical protein EDEG_01973 [Edhazardia aedis USNM 41457]|uniref:Uncharacterized protein n=1 Tax=Edhazardia aedis (strain USNM 41457) TaxID=1003232 RepID=J9DMB1_EDHAE|nr:hypothetical protein EDEG_01973 [Edhazardia aedis USNM 41457]|eukprot:EJW03735.1 hypothetical protein EDEG_01973 [Edhazardia aedis USNM 41457]
MKIFCYKILVILYLFLIFNLFIVHGQSSYNAIKKASNLSKQKNKNKKRLDEIDIKNNQPKERDFIQRNKKPFHLNKQDQVIISVLQTYKKERIQAFEQTLKLSNRLI